MTAKTLNERHPLLRWAWSLVRLDFVGIAVGALFFCLSLTPSLLPRDWLFAGLIGGINAAIGYGIGVLLGKALHRFVLRKPRLVATVEADVVLAPNTGRGRRGHGRSADADPRGSLATAGLGVDGYGRSGHARLSAHPDHRASRWVPR